MSIGKNGGVHLNQRETMTHRIPEDTPRESQQFRLTEVDEGDPPTLSRADDILKSQAVESNFGGLLQLVAFASDPPKRKLYVLEREDEKRLCIVATYPQMHDLIIVRLLFQRGSERDPKDEILLETLHSQFHPDYISYNLLPEDTLSEIDTLNTMHNTHMEFVYGLDRLLNCANPDHTVSRDPSVSIPHRAKEYHAARKNNASLVYVPFETIWGSENEEVNWRERINAFFKQWEIDTGFKTGNDRRLLDVFWRKPLLHGGVFFDTAAEKIVSLNCFSLHPSRTDMVISSIDKNVRGYTHLGVLSHITQALHIHSLGSQYTWILAGGKGSSDGQTAFKEGFMRGGEYRRHVSFEVYTDEQKLSANGMPHADREKREGLLRSLWK